MKRLLLQSVILSGLITQTVFANLVTNEKSFWNHYQTILDRVIVQGIYQSEKGTFFHHGVNYEDLTQNPTLNQEVQKQIEKLSNIKKIPDADLRMARGQELSSADRHRFLAFWINVYNFYTLEQIQKAIKNRPINSMKQIGWKKREVRVGKKIYHLDQVEHQKIRALKDPRIHFAVNCASVSCPTLNEQVFRSENLDQVLDQLVSNALKNPIHLRVEKGFWGKSLTTSKLFRWYLEDWGSSEMVLNFLQHYLPQEYLQFDDYSTSITYDWQLNRLENITQHLEELQQDEVKIK